MKLFRWNQMRSNNFTSGPIRLTSISNHVSDCTLALKDIWSVEYAKDTRTKIPPKLCIWSKIRILTVSVENRNAMGTTAYWVTRS